MATYTENYHLSKPETTDSQQSFIEDYAANMEIIDENMGGGSGGGGHVIINENGTEMAQEPNMQFAGKVSVIDDNINEKTVVTLPEEVKEVTLAEYESIPVAERESNGIAYFIKDLNNESVQGYPPLIYSDEEREVGVWRDGKPLYQKTIDCGTLPNNTTKNVNHNISDVETIFIVNAFGIINSSKESYPIPFAHRSTAGNQIQINVDGTKITLGTGGSLWTSLNGFVTICYTKTTDTKGSGRWTTQGTLAQHYSTTERLIGTWIDGKPLYQKTINLGSLPSRAYTNTDYPHNISNFGELIDIDIIVNTGSSYLKIDKQAYTTSGYAPQYSLSFAGVDSSNIKILVGTDRHTWSAVCTLQYTKTTD